MNHWKRSTQIIHWEEFKSKNDSNEWYLLFRFTQKLQNSKRLLARDIGNTTILKYSYLHDYTSDFHYKLFENKSHWFEVKPMESKYLSVWSISKILFKRACRFNKLGSCSHLWKTGEKNFSNRSFIQFDFVLCSLGTFQIWGF